MILVFSSCEKTNTPPSASFTISPAEGNDETIFVFDAGGSTDSEDSPEELLVIWDFEGDGIYDTQYSARKNADHIYDEPGEYLVELVVKDSRGLADTLRKGLTVAASNLPPDVPNNPSPENEASELGVNLYLSWESRDPDADHLLYTIYFGTEAQPPEFLKNHGQNILDPGKLEYGTTYYWRIKARDSEGNTTLGPVWHFSTIDLNFSSFTDSRDGREYETIEIGTQWWMAENLNYEADGSYCYNKEVSKCETYGRLYTWESAISACPDGWHLPSKQEFELMISHVGGEDAAGGQLKDYETNLWQGPNTGADNRSGFTALPSGRRYGENDYTGLKYYAQFYTSTEYSDNEAYNLTLAYDYSRAYLYNYKKEYAVSVRCVLD